MTDEFPPDRPGTGPSQDPYRPDDSMAEDHSEEAVQDHDPDTVMAGAGDFTSGEGLVAFAGLILLAVWLIFDLIVDNYDMDNVIAVIAAAGAVLPRMNRQNLEKIHPLPVLMKVVGWALVAFGLVEVILDIRFGVYDDFGVVIAALISYAAYAMAYMGARQIEI